MSETMTNEQKLDIVRMRIEGVPLQEIANAHGCSKQNICETLYRICDTGRDSLRYKKWIFPNIGKWLVANRKTLLWVSESLDISYASLNGWMMGKNRIHYGDMKRIADLLGMSLSEAFEERKERCD